jgi:hypothetical protein
VGSRPRSEPSEHPVTAWLAIAAILLVSTGIFSAYLELNGMKELDLVLAEAPSISAESPLGASWQGTSGIESREAAVATSRWATGFSQ